MAETTKKATKKKATETKTAPETYEVRVAVPALNIRKSRGYEAEIVRVIKADTVCEIAKEVDGWGKLKSGEGWICLDFVEKIEA